MAFRPSERLSRFGESHPPNLVPVMNLFLVLIPMLLTMAVTVKLAVMNLNLPSQPSEGNQQEVQKNPKKLENLIVVLTAKKDILLLGYKEGITRENKFIMGKNKGIKIPIKENKYDFHSFENYIKEIKKKYADQKSIYFACDESVVYENLIKAMDLCRRNGLPEMGIVEIRTLNIEF